jgi:hypothetical protein
MDDAFILIYSGRAPGPFGREHGLVFRLSAGRFFEIQGAIHAALVPFFDERVDEDNEGCEQAPRNHRSRDVSDADGVDTDRMRLVLIRSAATARVT